MTQMGFTCKGMVEMPINVKSGAPNFLLTLCCLTKKIHAQSRIAFGLVLSPGSFASCNSSKITFYGSRGTQKATQVG